MNKFRDMKDDLNRKNKTIERLKAMDGVKHSEKLEKRISELELENEIDLKNYREELKERKIELAECIKEKRKLEDAKK